MNLYVWWNDKTILTHCTNVNFLALILCYIRHNHPGGGDTEWRYTVSLCYLSKFPWIFNFKRKRKNLGENNICYPNKWTFMIYKITQELITLAMNMGVEEWALTFILLLRKQSKAHTLASKWEMELCFLNCSKILKWTFILKKKKKFSAYYGSEYDLDWNVI